MDKRYKGEWAAMENAGQSDFLAAVDFERQYNAGLLDEEWAPYPINRYQHSLQSATRVFNDGADDRVAR